MPALLLGLNAYKRTGLPEVQLINFYPESAPTSGSGSALLPFPGKVLDDTLGDGPIRGLYQQDGVFSGDIFTVSGDEVYRGDTLIDTVFGDDACEFAARAGNLYILSGGVIYEYDGATLDAMAFPDDADVASIADINGILCAARDGSGRFYYLLPGEADWQALDYQTAEREEDPLVAIRTTADEVWMFGTSTVEPFYPTGNAEQPFQRADGRSHAIGCRSRDTAIAFDNAVYWVDEQGRVVRDGTVVSEFGIAERISKASYLRAFNLAWKGHDFYALTMGGQGTFLLDAATGTWFERASYGLDEWIARCAVQVGSEVYLGSSDDGSVYRLSDDALLDDLTPISRTFTCAIPVQGAARCANVLLNCTVGNAPGEPKILLRWSDDQGVTFSEWRESSLGAEGEFRKRVVWRVLGLMDAPGRLFEFRTTDEVALRVSSADYNAPMGGRSR